MKCPQCKRTDLHEHAPPASAPAPCKHEDRETTIGGGTRCKACGAFVSKDVPWPKPASAPGVPDFEGDRHVTTQSETPPKGCCDEWPECSHILAWHERNFPGPVIPPPAPETVRELCVECHKRPAEVCRHCAVKAEQDAARDSYVEGQWDERERNDDHG